MATVQCPNLICRAILQIPEKVRGKTIRCGKCEMTFIVPVVAAAPKPAEPGQPAKNA